MILNNVKNIRILKKKERKGEQVGKTDKYIQNLLGNSDWNN